MFYIYKLESGDLCYYGSTTNPSNRLSKHKCRCSSKQYKSHLLFETGNEVNMTILETLDTDDLHEALEREAYYIRNFDCVNKTIPLRTRAEYREDKKEHIREYNKSYYETNKERCRNIQKAWRERQPIIECECGSKIGKDKIKRHLTTKKHINYLQSISK